jgi:5-methylcytosine-specific restriction endonuclease McrA
VRQRAGHRCEYCQLDQDDSPLAALHVEHAIPKAHGGGDDLDNLALACVDCNLHEGTNLTGLDPQTGLVTELFHPRKHFWKDQFHWRGIYVVGRTAIGRTTVRVLKMNSEDQLALRSS